jgi:hypothetical protein
MNSTQPVVNVENMYSNLPTFLPAFLPVYFHPKSYQQQHKKLNVLFHTLSSELRCVSPI